MDTPINFRAVVAAYLAAHAEGRLYFLLDHAGLPGLMRMLDSCALQWASLFDDTRESTALSVAPILVEIVADNRHVRPFLDWVARHGAYSSAVTMLDSPLPLDLLQRRLAARLEITLSDDMAVMLRFFDPRILAQLRSTLTVEQAAAFFSAAKHWWYIDRAGTLVEFDADFAFTDAAGVPLVLSPEQESAMVDASEADQVLALLHRNVPNLIAEIALSECYQFVVSKISKAKLAGLASIHDFITHMVKEFDELKA